MKRKRTKRLITTLMSVIMLLGILPVLPGGSIKATAAKPDVTKFATKDELMTKFDLEGGSSTIGRIKFGVDGTDKREWLIVGEDKENGTLALLSTSSFDHIEYGSNSKYSTSAVKSLLGTYTDDATYFSSGEKAYMIETTVSTVEYDGTERTAIGKLYLPDAEDRESYGETNIYVGTKNNIQIDLGNLESKNGFTASYFWLRSPHTSDLSLVLVAFPGSAVTTVDVRNVCAVVPAFNLDLSSVLFASAVSITATGGKLEEALTVRYESSDLGSATINSEQTSVTVSDVSPYTHLVVQKDSGAWVKRVDGNSTILAGDVNVNGVVLTSFKNCKVWLEKTDTDRITTATMATVKSDYSVQVTSGSYMTLDSGNDAQDVSVGSPMKNVVYEAEDDYYFPLNYGQDINGITVARIDSTHISVSGWPTANTEITLKDASTISERSTVVTSKKNINLRANVLTTNYDDTWASGDTTVYYGQYNGTPVLYRVLEADGTIALLDSDTVLYSRTFNASSVTANAAQRSEKPNECNGSDLQADLNGTGFYNNTDVFTSAEKAAILKSYLGGADSYKAGRHNIYYTDYPAYTYIFPLSASESVNYYGKDAVAKKNLSNAAAYWWLRSANPYYSILAGAVDSASWLGVTNVDNADAGVAPAFNLDLTSVIFTSASGADKTSFEETTGVNDTNSWKLTLSDGNENFTASCSDTSLIAGEENQIEITGINNATDGSNQITAALTNKEDEILYYGKIAEANAESATVTIPKEANLTVGDDYTLKVFSEQVNGNKETDYASNMVSISFTAMEQVASVTASPDSGSYETPQNVELSTATADAKIFYTTDGTDPTKESISYDEAISVENTQTIKAIAVKDGMANSKVSTFEYIIKQNPAVDDLAYDPAPVIYNKTARELTVTAKDGEDLGDITVKYNGSTQAPVNAGTYKITVDISGSYLWNSVTDIALGDFTIKQKTLTNVSSVIPDVKQDSALTLDNQTLVLHSNDIEDGDSVSGNCQVTLGSTALTGSYQDAKVEVEGVDNPNYTFTGTLNEQSYTVTEKTLTSIKITTLPDKDTYFAGEVFDKTGMVVTAYYDSGDPISLESNEYSISPSGGLTSNDETITVSYGGMTDTTSITVKEVELTDIIIEKVPNKTEYIIGQSFSDIGMVVKAKYNNGTKQVISGYGYSPKDALTTVGTQDITISYTEEGITKETIQKVNVIAKVVTNIEVISQPTQRNYIEGQKLSLSGLVVNLIYNDESSQEVAIDEFESLGITTSIANGTVLSVGEHNCKAITVTCEGINVETESLTVEAKAVTGLEIKNPPKQLSYTAGEALDLSGLIVTLIYNNGNTADVAYTDFKAVGITVNVKDGDILTSSDNGSSILVTYNDISVSAGELTVTPQLYQITTGAGSTYEIGSKNPILIICSGALSDLTGIYVDGILLDQANYTVKSGSTILTLNPDYLDSLTVGTHSLRLEYLNGSAETTLKVVKAKQAETDAKKTTTPTSKTTTKTGTSAKTGDTATVMLWVTLVLLSGIVMGGFVWYLRKRRR